MAPSTDQVANYTVFLHSYLANFLYCLTICIGALFFVLVTNLARAAWCATIRRVAEILALNIGWWAVMFLPILVMVFMGRGGFLYEWNDAATTELPADKLMYLNGGWFTVRALVYFCYLGRCWLLLLQQESRTRRNRQRRDFAQTTAIRWACDHAVRAFAKLCCIRLDHVAGRHVVQHHVRRLHLCRQHDVFLCFYDRDLHVPAKERARTEVCQRGTPSRYEQIPVWFRVLLVLHYLFAVPADLVRKYSEETQWFDRRMNNGWEYVGLLIILGHFAFPMLCLLSRHVRRNRTVMCGWAIFLLVMHWVDITFMIMPETGNPGTAMWLGHIVCAVGMVCMFLSVLILRVGSTPLVAKRNPWVPEALSYHVM